jgi:hypothetical protein
MRCPRCSGANTPERAWCAVCASDLHAAPLGDAPPEPLHGPVAPVLRVRSRFCAAKQLRTHAPVYLFLAAWGTFFAGGLCDLILAGAGSAGASGGRGAETTGTWPMVVAAGVVLLPLVPLVGLALSRWVLGHSEFVFFPHRADLRRPLLYRDVVSVSCEGADPIDPDSMGTIVLSTPRSSAGLDPPVRLPGVPGAAALATRIAALVTPFGEPELAHERVA